MNRKILGLTIIFVLLGCMLSFGSGYARNLSAYFYNIKVSLDGKPVAFSNEPFVYNGATYVSLRDVSEALGMNVYWDENSKSIYIHSGSSDYSNNPYDVEALRNQLKDKDKEIEKLKNDSKYSSSSSSSSRTLDKVEDNLEDSYYKYTKGTTDLRFDFSLTQSSNDNIIVEMKGNFDRSSSAWSNRRSSDFRSYIDDVCREIKKEFSEDIEITVYDEDKDRAAKYYYDYSDREIRSGYDEY